MWCDVFPVKIPTVNFPDDLSFSFHANQTLSNIIGNIDAIKEVKSSRYYMYEMMWYNIMHTFNTGILHIFWTDDHFHLHLHHTSTRLVSQGWLQWFRISLIRWRMYSLLACVFNQTADCCKSLAFPEPWPDIPGWLIETEVALQKRCKDI